MKLSHIASALTFAVLLSQCTVSAPKEAPLVLGPHQVLVKRGENIYSIASANNVSVRELIAVNMLEPPYAVADGQVLLLPKKKATARSRKNDFADPQGPVLINEQLPTAPSQDLGAPADDSMKPFKEELFGDDDPSKKKDGEVINKEFSEELSKSAIEEPLGKPEEKPAEEKKAAGAVSFSMPANGTVATKFKESAPGSKKKCNGIKISTPSGTSVVASENGTVFFAGSELGTNLVLIEHQGKWMTVYGNLASICVKKGQTINKGQQIGSSSDTTYFELRNNRKLVDPLSHIKQ